MSACSTEIPGGGRVIQVIDTGQSLSLTPDVQGRGEFYFEQSNEGTSTSHCEVLAVDDRLEVAELLERGQDEEFRETRLQLELVGVQAGESGVTHVEDGIPQGMYLVVCGDDDPAERSRGALFEIVTN